MKNSIVIFFLLSILTFIRSDTSKLELSKELIGVSDSNVRQYYELYIENSTKKDLAINVSPKDFLTSFCDPDVYISKVNKTPDEYSEWVFDSYGPAFGIISQFNITQNTTFYIAVNSYSKCEFSINAYLVDEREISEQELIVINKNKEFIGVYNNNLTELKQSLEFHALTFEGMPFKLSVYKDNFLRENEIPSIPTFFGGEMVKISNDSNYFCTNCKYYIQLSTTSKEDISIDFKIKQMNRFIQLNPKKNQRAFGYSMDNEVNCYNFNTNGIAADESLIISTTHIEGSSDLFIKFNTKPDDIIKEGLFDIVKKLSEDEFLKIAPETRKHYENLEKPVFLCLKSSTEDQSSYILRVFLESSIENPDNFTPLNNGIVLNGYVPSKKISKHLIVDYSENDNLTASLEIVKGNSILYGFISEKRIANKFDSEVLSTLQKNNEIYNSTKKLGNQYLHINDNINKCHRERAIKKKYDLSCAVYAIVYCDDDIECSYKITSKSRKNINLLVEKQQQSHFVSFNDTDYFRFQIWNDNVENITIAFNSLNGYAEMYVSRKNKHPNSTDNDKIGNSGIYASDIIKIEKKGNESLKGEYYVAVHGLSYTYYNIIYYTESTKKILTPKKISSLHPGVFVKDKISLNENKIYKFYVDLTKSENKNITVLLSSELGVSSFDIYNDYEMTSANLVKEKLGQSIMIDPTTPGYIEKGYYYVKVTLKGLFNFSKNLTTSETSGIFLLGYSYSDHAFALHNGMSLKISQKLNTTIHLVYHFSKLDSNFAIGFSNLYSNSRIYADTENKDKNYKNSKLKYKLDKNLVLKGDDFIGDCPKNNDFCDIHLFIESHNSVFNLNYSSLSITVKTLNVTAVLLNSESTEARNDLQLGETQYYYYYVTKEDHGALILEYVSGMTHVEANLLSFAESNIGKSKWRRPTETEHDLETRKGWGGETISIKKESVKNCSPYCILFLAVRGNNFNGLKNYMNFEYKLKFEKKVVAITNEVPYFSIIQEGNYQYFTFSTGSNAKNIYVSLTNQFGNTMLSMNYGMDSFPTIEGSDWTSLTSFSEFIDVFPEDEYFVKNSKTLENSNFTIGVYGFSNSSYTLYVSTNPIKIHPLNSWKGSSCQSKSNKEICYFRLDETLGGPDDKRSTFIQDLLVSTDFSYGSGRIFAKKYFISHYNVYSNLPGKTDHDWSSDEQNSSNFLKLSINDIKDKKKDNASKTAIYTLIFAVECDGECLFTLHLDLAYLDRIKFTDTLKENLVYLPPHTNQTIFSFLTYDSEYSLNLNLYSGRAQVLILMPNKDKTETIEDFYVDSKSNEKSIQKTISRKFYLKQIMIIFKTESSSCSLNMKIHPFSNQLQIPIGKVTNYYTSLDTNFIGYFYFPPFYKQIVINVIPQIQNIEGELNVNIVKIDKNKSLNETINNNVPNSNNNEYHSVTNTIQKLSLKIDKFFSLSKTDTFIGIVSIQFNQKLYPSNSNTFLPIISTPSNFTHVKTKIPFSVSILKKMHKIEKLKISSDVLHYGLLNLEDPTSGNLYEISPEDSSKDLTIIEISSCSAKIDFVLGDTIPKGEFMEAQDVSDRVENYVKETKYGRTIISTKNKNGLKSHYLFTYANKGESRKLCKNNNNDLGCYNNSDVEYLIRYKSRNESELIEYEPINGLKTISYSLNGNRVSLKWNALAINKPNDPNFIPSLATTNYTIFYSENFEDFPNMGSICFLSGLNSYESNTNFTQIEFKSERVFINVVGIVYDVQSLESRDYVAFDPIEIYIQPPPNGHGFITTVSIVLVLFLIFILIRLYKKYVSTKRRLDYEMNDVRNLASGSKSEVEIQNIKEKKYESLSDNASKI